VANRQAGGSGFYGYDLIENLGSKRGIRSAGKIVRDLQRLAVGDWVYLSSIVWAWRANPMVAA
jgi:hypothetical protein